MDDQEEILLDIEALTYGRAGVGRIDGKVVFAERVAPGDRIRARLVEDRGSFARAETLEVLEAGASRVDPPCPIVATCGGCPWQQVEYSAQLEAKRRNVIDALERIGGFADPEVAPIVASPEQFGYRNRLKLRYDRGRLGFYSANTHRLVPVEDCMIAEERVRQALPAVSAFLPALSTRPTRVEIAERGRLAGVVVAINAEGRLRRADNHKLREFVESTDNEVSGVVMWGRGWRREWGDTSRVHETSERTSVRTVGAVFGQVNSAANELLIGMVVDLVAPTPQSRVLDLFAGAGNFSFPLAERADSVLAVERDAAAVEAGRAMATSRGRKNVRFETASVSAALARGLRGDRIVVNPPRSGLSDTAEAIAEVGAPDIVYVSCNPTTLARDLRVFAQKGYAVSSIMPIDLFPQTFHVETVCHARLT